MRRILIPLALMAIGAAAMIVAACGKEDSGLSVLGGSSPPGASLSASPSASPTVTASPSATVTVTSSPTPSISGTATTDPFGAGEATAADLEAYLAEVKPIYKEVVRIERIADGTILEISGVPDPSWDTAARRVKGFADEIQVQHDQWVVVAPPPGLEEAHRAGGESLAKEVEMLDLLATQLRDRTWDPVKGTKDVNRLGKEMLQLRDSYRRDLEAMADTLGVRIPWRWK